MFFLAYFWCPLVFLMEYLGCLVTNSYVRPVHVMKNPDLVILIYFLVTGLHIPWEK